MSQKQPNRFNPYSEDEDRAGPDAKTRRIENPTGGFSNRGSTPERDSDDWRSMVTPQDKDWRSSRRGERSQRASGPMSAMPGGFLQWMAQGGAKYLVGGAVLLIGALVFFLASGGPPDTPTTPTPRPQPAQQGQRTKIPSAGITVVPDGSTDGVVPTTTPEAPATGGGERLTVAGTGVEGLFMRDAPQGNLVLTLPEGTQVEVVGPDQEAGGRIWKNIREPGGTEGWAASDFLQPAQ